MATWLKRGATTSAMAAGGHAATVRLDVADLAAVIAFVVSEGFGIGCFLRDCAGNLIEYGPPYFRSID